MRSTTGVLILFLGLSPQLVLLVKTRIIFRLLNEVCMQTTFGNESETTTLVKTLLLKVYTDMHFTGFIALSACVHKIIEQAEDGSMLLL